MKVCKFGGSSLSTSKNMERALAIVKADRDRQIIVVSAPGKVDSDDIKVTDLLINVANKYNCFEYDYIVSRGEYIMAKLFSKISGYNFVDAKDYIIINQNGKVNEMLTKQRLKKLPKPCVIGGFYGSDIYGNIRTFARGGSDYTGAVIAALLNAEVYENYTDTNGVFTCDPNQDANCKHIEQIGYDQMYDMAKSGARVIYAECLPLLKKYKVQLIVRNTFNPNGGYTVIK
ncbi:MAG: hypothetical protein FWD32_02360 [Firmicutes bacterium]|nr:hypothetical protein [Bacillota bacterium]